MKFVTIILALVVAAALVIVAWAIPASAEIVYTQVNVAIPFNGGYGIDLDNDGTTDFYLRTWFLGGAICYRNVGTESTWLFYVIPTGQNGVVSVPEPKTVFAVPLRRNVLVDGSQFFSSSFPIIGEVRFGTCGTSEQGLWFGLIDRYLGLQFRAADGSIHYGWAKISTTVQFLQNGRINTSSFVSGFAYETIPNQGILTGQTSG